MELTLLPGYPFPEEIRALFSEYTGLLLEKRPDFRGYLAQQSYEDELAHLELKYGPPDGRLWLARVGEQPAGCIALRRIDRERCEMKRLFVRPGFRGSRLGTRLVEQIVADARQIGYREMLLDTFPFLESAIRLYREAGFREVPSYNGAPMEGLVYMKLEL